MHPFDALAREGIRPAPALEALYKHGFSIISEVHEDTVDEPPIPEQDYEADPMQWERFQQQAPHREFRTTIAVWRGHGRDKIVSMTSRVSRYHLSMYKDDFLASHMAQHRRQFMMELGKVLGFDA